MFRPVLGSGRSKFKYKRWLRRLRGKSGVYVLKKKYYPDLCLYVGESHSDNLYKTITRHFQGWFGANAGHVYNPRLVVVSIYVTDKLSSVELQNELIKIKKPRDNFQEVLPF